MELTKSTFKLRFHPIFQSLYRRFFTTFGHPVRNMKISIRLFLPFFFSLIVLASKAQTGDVRGFVYDKATSQPVSYINVFLQGTSFGTQTNLDGYFIITKVPQGSYTLVVVGIGFDSLSTPISVTKNGIVNKKFFISPVANELGTVTVTAEQEAKKTAVRVSVVKITPKEIKQVPSIGADPDIAQYLQVLPGVISTGDQGGQLYIRGGTPDQNKVMLDGMTIYNPFHSIGLFSVFETDVIKGADIYTGGFNAQYGGALSSIIDITTRDGNKKRLSGSMSASTFNAKLILEGPLKKAANEDDGTTSFMIVGKTSYLQESSKVFYKYIDTTGQGLPYDFGDIYGKISFNSPAGNKFNLFGFHFSDNVDYPDVALLKWNSTGFGSNFVLVPASSTVLIDGHFAYSVYNVSLTQQAISPISNRISNFNFGLNFTYFIRKDEVKYGIEISGGATELDFYNSLNRQINESSHTTEAAGYIKYKKVIKNLVLEPSLRFTYYATFSELPVEPRLGAKYNVTDKFRLKLAAGYYSQNLLSTSSQQNIVNLFNGYVLGSDNLPSSFNGESVTSLLQKARHTIFGFEADLPYHMAVNVEGYYKSFDQLENLNTNKLYPDDGEHASIPDNLKKDFIIESGTAKGIDFVLKYDYRRINLWAVYSLSYVDRFDGAETYTPVFDRRHNVNLVGAYIFGKNLNWEVNARWNYGSGFPFTLTQGFYEQLTFNTIYTDYIKANGQLGIQYADRNTGHLSDYHRLDISVKRTFTLSGNSTLSVVGSVINVYDRKNIFYVNRVTGQRVYQLPVLPSIGANFTF